MQHQKVVEYIVNWLKNYAKNAGSKGFVIGISGGVDSALTSTLCAKTGLDVLCLEMPIHQAKNQIDRAVNHISWLQQNFSNVQRQQVNLTSVFESFKAEIPPEKNEDLSFLSLANTRARFRMSTLYYFAAIKGMLVAGTGNKVEDFGVGFYTKYGDGGVDVSPIADLLKTEVFALAQVLGVNKEILEAAPTDGLWGDDRSDEDQLGASYPELEWAMEQQTQHKTDKDFTGRRAEVMRIYLKLNKANQHKMQPIPVCIIPSNLK